MNKIKLIVVLGLFLTMFTVTLGPTVGNSAAYQWVARLVGANGFVANFTASATAASYQHTCQVVDQNGTVMNPGAASATTASPDCIIRVVDASNKVQSSLGGSAALTPTINTTVSHGAPAAASTTVAVPAGTAAGDRLLLVTDSQSSCSSTTLPAWTNITEMVNSGNSANAVTSNFQYNIVGGFFGAFTKIATAADAASGTYAIASCGTTIFHYVMVDVTRSDGVTPNIDRLLEGANNSSASQTAFSVTTNRNSEVVLTILDHVADNTQCTSTNNTNLFNGSATESLAASYNNVATLGSTSTAATFTCGTAQQAIMWVVGFF